MQGFGGFTGCILGGYLCSTNNSRVCFALVALLGLAVFFAGLKIDKKKE
jgi:predicted MFS family arabinose efflux permease